MALAALLGGAWSFAADRTLGNTEVGALWKTPGASYKFGSIFTLSEQGTATSFSWHVRGGSAPQRFIPLVYSCDGTGRPLALVATGTEVTVAAGRAAGWVNSPLTPASLAPGRYLLGLLSGPAGSGASNSAATSAGAGRYNANAYPTPSATFGTAITEDLLWSFYLTYTPGPGPPGTQPIRFRWRADPTTLWSELRRYTLSLHLLDTGFSARVEASACPKEIVREGRESVSRLACTWTIAPADKDFFYETMTCNDAGCSPWVAERVVWCAEDAGYGCPCHLFPADPGCTE